MPVNSLFLIISIISFFFLILQDIFWEFEDGVTAIVAYQTEGQHTRKLIGGVEISFTLKKELLSAWKPVTRLSLNVLGGSGEFVRSPDSVSTCLVDQVSL